MMRKIVFLFYFLLPALLSAQPDSSAQIAERKNTYTQLLNSKQNINSSVALGVGPMSLIPASDRGSLWRSVSYQSQWFEMGYEFGTLKETDLRPETNLSLFRVGAYLPLNNLSVGRRLYDVYGVMLVPGAALSYTSTSYNKILTTGLRLSPEASLQMPFCAIDLRVNIDYRFNTPTGSLKKFSLTPELRIRFDGLYNLLDPEQVYVGHAEGTITSRSYDYNTTSHRDGDYIITTTTRTESVSSSHYSIDRYINSVGPFVAIGPHYTFKYVPYAGPTEMYGLGYYVRTGCWSADLLLDFGKAGFASRTLKPQTIADPMPGIPKANKEEDQLRGYYNTQRIQFRYGIDLIELYASAFGASITATGADVKFSRITGGVGAGYALMSEAHYLRSDGRALADSLFLADVTLLTTSANLATRGRDGFFFSPYVSLEAGSLRISFEKNIYIYAGLANVNSVSVAYLLPYNRILKKYKAIRSYQRYINSH